MKIDLPNATLFIQMGLFLFFIFITNRFLLRPYSKLTYEREEQSEGARGESLKLKEQSRKLQEDYTAKMIEAQKLMGIQLSEMKRNISRDQLSVVDKFRSECHEELRKTQEKIRILLAQEKASVDQEAKKMGQDIVKFLLG